MKNEEKKQRKKHIFDQKSLEKKIFFCIIITENDS